MIIFTDIDDTLMKTQRKIANIETCYLGALNHKGLPNSFIDPSRWSLIQNLLLKGISIPVSARSRRSFNNLALTFKYHAVLNFGGTIIDADQKLNQEWHSEIKHQSDLLRQDLIFSKIKQLANNLTFSVKFATDDDISHAIYFREEMMQQENIIQLKQMIENFLDQNALSDKFYFHQTDRDLAVIPSFITKKNAVIFLKDRFYKKDQLTIGIGDHQNDLDFMRCCDFIMIPTDSTLMRLINDTI